MGRTARLTKMYGALERGLSGAKGTVNEALDLAREIQAEQAELPPVPRFDRSYDPPGLKALEGVMEGVSMETFCMVYAMYERMLPKADPEVLLGLTFTELAHKKR